MLSRFLNVGTTTLLAVQIGVQAVPTTQPAPFDPRPYLTEAINRLRPTLQDTSKFTFLERIRVIGYTASGQKYYDVARTYDYTWINNLPYLRLLKINDQPLSPKDELKEQTLYDKEVAKHGDLGPERRARLAGLGKGHLDINIEDALSANYKLTVDHIEATGNDSLFIVDAYPIPQIKPKTTCPWHYRFWISAKDHYITRYYVDTPDGKSLRCFKSVEDASFQLIDGFPEILRRSIRFHEHDSAETAADDYIFSNYRRFTTNITITPGTVVEPTDPNPPQPQ